VTPIVLLHGFAGHASAWDDVVGDLARANRRASAITLFGHDPNIAVRSNVSFDDEAARVASSIAAIGEPVRLCGYSMGGRVALGVLARAPELVASAVLVGAHPGLESDADRRERAASDELWARMLEEQGIETFVAKWEAQALFATQASAPAERLARQRATRLAHDPRSLACAMRSLGLAAMPSYWDVLERLAVPLDLVVGAHDTKFTALAERMERASASGTSGASGRAARITRVPNVGHNVSLEAPAALATLLADR
jgi:2-succinyl-6-hydroxy-2,4-cyclohexadiene-1-carboxylate synthase